MSQQVVLIRHAKSSWRHDVADHLRPLKLRGYQAAEIMAQRHILRDAMPDIILSSPAVRAYTTASSLIAELQLESGLLVVEPSLYPGDAKALLALIKQRRESRIWLVGHNPAMHELAELLAGEAIEAFPTLAVATFEISQDSHRLIAFDYPKNTEL
ncbi:histidine phosphatase family protein [Neiella sp. HB171785]|uniref:Histidine phosphatase family protein n=1 Tax=Neiella litorisoli TaxID=2771431 RepID=A0A8J6ULA3_9GAMM|nr:histidine phosphatase family protein [Neiella litorisoli]MBD1388575.1 histidine phosphatase family protein [Neiella litorisoli]